RLRGALGQLGDELLDVVLLPLAERRCGVLLLERAKPPVEVERLLAVAPEPVRLRDIVEKLGLLPFLVRLREQLRGLGVPPEVVCRVALGKQVLRRLDAWR